MSTLTISMPVIWCNLCNNLTSKCGIVLFNPWVAAPILPAAIIDGGNIINLQSARNENHFEQKVTSSIIYAVRQY